MRHQGQPRASLHCPPEGAVCRGAPQSVPSSQLDSDQHLKVLNTRCVFRALGSSAVTLCPP